ncbi:hypothetical protein [Thioalkalivibrio sp. HK1]|uniref:hypothetical protein n=1 Tax=Thioalkalivibrio sp. HK1 TaxID=1469245 RepID=UPI000470FCD8|nr:hypothetical protein [Thioalkalivibrio sp. HK1]
MYRFTHALLSICLCASVFTMLDRSALAQTEAAHLCVFIEDNSGELSVTNRCDHAIEFNHRATISGVCSGKNETVIAADESTDSDGGSDTHPSRYCVEYQDSATQTAAGYQGCGNEPTDCGTSGRSEVIPAGVNVVSGSIVLSPTGALTIDEGKSGNFSVSLSAAPSGVVTVALTKTNSRVTVSPTSLTFTDSNYQTAQQVTVATVDDDDATDGSDTITLSASGGIIAPAVTKTVSVRDGDTAQFNLSTISMSLEEGEQGTFGLRPDTRPSANITVALTSSNADITVDTDPTMPGNQTTLAFNQFGATNAWNQHRTIRVFVGQDNDADDESVDINITGTGGDYQGKSAKVTVSITDDDKATGSIVLSPAGTLIVREGSSARLDVSLSTPPSGDVSVILSNDNSLRVSLFPTSLTFTASNYQTAQRITLTAANDDNATNESDTITLVASGGLIAPAATKAVRVVDDDEAGFLLEPDLLTLDEGAQGTFDIRPAFRPSADIMVILTPSSRDITVDTDPNTPGNQTTLAFNQFGATNAWNRHRRVGVFADHDIDANDESFHISVVGAGGDYQDKTASVAILVADDDPPRPPAPDIYLGGVVVSPSILTLSEGGRTSFSVALDSAPSSNVTIGLSKTNPDITLVSHSITFTPSTWQKTVDVGIVAAEDSDALSDSDTITFAIRPWNRRAYSLAVFITDNDPSPVREAVKAQALAIPPPQSGDDMTLRIHCKQDSSCFVIFECTTQVDGTVFEGHLLDPIPAHGAKSLSSADIQRLTGWTSWAQSGRLGCALRSHQNISAQVWTRSGAGVLVNNSAIIRSRPDGGDLRRIFRADIESIPSPDAFDEPNIRIRCNSQESHCSEVQLFCYTDDGTRYETTFEGLARGRTIHLQSAALATRLGVRWKGLGLTCEAFSEASFTVQVLARTGGGGALINNSATGIR